jgi:dTDP-4-amino-4,6-dideoxy-D-galactose acyltransferase
MKIDRDTWLSGVLGRASWKVSALSVETKPTDIRAVMLDRAGTDPAFFSVKIPTSDVVAVSNAAKAGFSVIDVNVTFDWLSAPGALPDDVRDSDVTIGFASPGDAAAIEQVAAGCFTFSRFHRDPGIGTDRANEIKRQWARNACGGRAATVYVAKHGDDVAGFLAVLKAATSAGTDAIIDLIGIGADYQGQGAGRALSRMFVAQWRDQADRLRVGTQVANIPAMRLYESIGFRVTETAYVLHAHVINGALAA